MRILFVIFTPPESADAGGRPARPRAQTFENCAVNFIEISGTDLRRGSVLKRLWDEKGYDVFAYSCADIVVDADTIRDIAVTLSGGFDIAAGSRRHPLSRGRRTFWRNTVTGIYNKTLGILFKPYGCSDAQCHLKAIRRERAQRLLPRIISGKSFFDTEMLIKGGLNGMKIKEIPVRFTGEGDGLLDILRYLIEDVAGIIRLKSVRIKNG